MRQSQGVADYQAKIQIFSSCKQSLGETHKHSCDELSRPVNVSSALYKGSKKINYLHHEKRMKISLSFSLVLLHMWFSSLSIRDAFLMDIFYMLSNRYKTLKMYLWEDLHKNILNPWQNCSLKYDNLQYSCKIQHIFSLLLLEKWVSGEILFGEMCSNMHIEEPKCDCKCHAIVKDLGISSHRFI